MVAGMVMPLAELRAIYELLFWDGVIVAKKDKHPQSMHPDLTGVTNLKVIRAMGSLKSKGCVRETFTWKHAYYYLTNEGIAYLRDYLHLPPEIMPAPLQSLRRPESSARVLTVKGPTSYIPKPKPGREIQEDRHIYRYKRVGQEREQSERSPKNFRGSYHCDASVGRLGVQTKKGFCREEPWANEGNRKSFGASYLLTEDRVTRCPDSAKEDKLPVSLVPSSSIVPKSSKEIPTVPMTPRATVKEVLQKFVKMTAAHPSAAFVESECVKVPEDTTKGTPEEWIPDPRESPNPASRVPREYLDRPTIPLLTELTEKEERQDVNDQGEEADVATEETVEKYDVELMKRLNVELFVPVTKAKTFNSDLDLKSATLYINSHRKSGGL
ncbi:hypothetical protein VZT92_015211 [Zoarces viviparus]|uniref:Plectin/eS10 N-terminal domain-containing protein n=1 Tax=Zoarces viviparus TaxID=48416 RepID=A0AAW1EVA7_ZOAVI